MPKMTCSPLVFSATDDAARALVLFAGVMDACEVMTDRMAERAASDFLTVTELADSLVRREGVNFRAAHHLVSATVKALAGKYSASAMAATVEALAPAHFGRPLQISHEDLLQALDPRHFVNIRNIPGGPSPEALRPALRLAHEHLSETRSWIGEKASALEAYPARIKAEWLSTCPRTSNV